MPAEEAELLSLFDAGRHLSWLPSGWAELGKRFTLACSGFESSRVERVEGVGSSLLSC